MNQLVIKIILSLVVLNSAHGGSFFKSSCPSSFVGRVIKVESHNTNKRSVEKIKILFDVFHSVDSSKSQKEVLVAKNGPFQFDEGHLYKVEMNQQFLCNAELL